MTEPARKRESSDNPGDEDLIARVAAGDAAAFRQFTDRYTGLVFSLAWRMAHNREAAEDIVQETFLRVWRHAGNWRPDKGASVRTWLCRIASNLCIDSYRKGSRETVLPDFTALEDEGGDASRTVQERQRGQIVGRALQALPERQRVALVLFHYERMSMAETASVLGTSVKAAENLLYRGRQALKKELEQYQGVL